MGKNIKPIQFYKIVKKNKWQYKISDSASIFVVHYIQQIKKWGQQVHSLAPRASNMLSEYKVQAPNRVYGSEEKGLPERKRHLS